MSRCRCDDIKTIERDKARLNDMDDVISRMSTTLTSTDDALKSLKSALQSAVDVSLGGVSSDLFSATGKDQLSSAQSQIASRKETLDQYLADCRSEDAQYHEEVRLAWLRRLEEENQRREENRKRMEENKG